MTNQDRRRLPPPRRFDVRRRQPFKIRAYRAAAETIEDTATPLADMISEGGVARSICEVPGVGGHQQEGRRTARNRHVQAYEDVKAKIPETTLDLLKVEESVEDIAASLPSIPNQQSRRFAKFVEGGGLSVPRLGEKTQDRIRASLKELLK